MCRILLIEKREPWINLIINSISSKKNKVWLAENFSQAVAIAISHQPDLLIFDENNNVIYNFRLIDFIRSNSLLAKIPIVLLIDPANMAKPENYKKYEPLALLPRVLTVNKLKAAVGMFVGLTP